MKILLAHNFYQHPGGEDQVFRAERDLLRSAGQDVVTFERSNTEIAAYNAPQRVVLAARTVWARDSYASLLELLRREKPDVAHFHNFLPLFSPSVYYACEQAGVPVVQTLHNFRLVCPSGILFRDGHLCEECLHSPTFRPALIHGCYRNDRPATAAVAAMLATHRMMGTWSERVSCFLALSEFAREKLLAAGLPPDRVVVKPNFMPGDPGVASTRGDYALFIGRLVPEKGIPTLLGAWARLQDPPPLKIAGEGPLRSEVQRAVDNSHGRIQWCGQVPRERAVELIQQARLLVFPSEWYEAFPLVLIESLACGTPVVAARIGSVAEIVADGVTGIHFRPGDRDDLVARIQWAQSNPQALEKMGRAARQEFLSKYTGEQNYRSLMAIYQRVRRVTADSAGSPTPADGAKSKPSVMIAHDFYQHRGGEDNVVEAEHRVLTQAGHRVLTFFRSNSEIEDYSWWQKGKLGLQTVWRSPRDMRLVLERERPDLVHFHNFLPLLSPAHYYACRDLDIPVVQTLHNYRLLCPSATLYRDDRVCEECLGHAVPWPGVVHKCYRKDRLASTAVASMIATHELLGTWKNAVDCYIALSEFARSKFAQNGIPEHKIAVKPNCIEPDPGPRPGRGAYALFVGRMSPEKGVRTLIEAWLQLSMRVPLVVVGEGPLAAELSARSSGRPWIQWHGWQPKDKVIELMKGARFLVLPSNCYENFPVTLAEAFACQLPVLASRLGALLELVDSGRTGLHFLPGDAGDLRAKAEWAWSHPSEMEEMGRNARREYEQKYTPSANYAALLAIYQRVLAARHGLEQSRYASAAV